MSDINGIVPEKAAEPSNPVTDFISNVGEVFSLGGAISGVAQKLGLSEPPAPAELPSSIFNGAMLVGDQGNPVAPSLKSAFNPAEGYAPSGSTPPSPTPSSTNQTGIKQTNKLGRNL